MHIVELNVIGKFNLLSEFGEGCPAEVTTKMSSKGYLRFPGLEGCGELLVNILSTRNSLCSGPVVGRRLGKGIVSGALGEGDRDAD